MTDDYVPYPATIVVDANTLISATLTRGITREMLLTTEDTLYSPAFIRDEIEKHRATLTYGKICYVTSVNPAA